MRFVRVSLILAFLLGSQLAWSAQPFPSPQRVALLRPKLNSERIEFFFGSYGISPLLVCQNEFPGSRISNLFSLEKNRKILRTLAVVKFVEPVDPQLSLLHQKILTGASMGSTFQESGWKVEKESLYFGELNSSRPLLELMGLTSEESPSKSRPKSLGGVPTKVAVHIYRFSVRKSKTASPIVYSQIIEVHSPEYLTLDWLKALYGKTNFQETSQANLEITKLLEQLQRCLSSL